MEPVGIFAQRLREAMELRNMKQADLCRATGIPKSAMSQYLSGAFLPKQDRLWALSGALQVNEAWLMGYDGIPMERKPHGTMGFGTLDQKNQEAISTLEVEREEIGRRIKLARTDRGLTQGDIAQSIGVAVSTVQRYETGSIEKIKMPVIEAIARALKVNPAWLLGKIEDDGMDLLYKKPATTSDSELLKLLNTRPSLKELVYVLSQLDDDHLKAFIMTVGAPINDRQQQSKS